MNDVDMDTDMELDDISSPNNFSIEQHYQHAHDQQRKMRKKPGRKPNPASPALRKAQNRAAQRAFRQRKDNHLRELEVAIKQIREQRDKLYLENEQLKMDAEISRSENWYLKGIVLTLQLVCYQHNLAIPQHSPFVSEQALSLMAQSTPEPISAYLSVNANSKLPTLTQLSGYRHSIKQRDRYLSSGAIIVTKDDVSQQKFPPLQSLTHPLERYRLQPLADDTSTDNDHLHTSNVSSSSSSTTAVSHTSSTSHQQRNTERDEDGNLPLPNLSPVERPHLENVMTTPPLPRAPSIEPITSNLAAIQTLRLRLRLQSACARMDSIPFSIQPSILQLTIPHDPRIDLIPTPHMRDRMILFREQFDLDDCFTCILHGAVFHGDDPGVAANWQLPKAFFEKYWFLTIDYTLRRTTNRWRRLQGLNELENNLVREDEPVLANGPLSDSDDKDDTSNTRQSNDGIRSNRATSTSSWGFTNTSASGHFESTAGLVDMPALESQQRQTNGQAGPSNLPPSINSGFGMADLSSYLGVEFSKLEQERQAGDNARNSPSLDPSRQRTSTLNDYRTNDDTFEPVRLTNGYLLPPKTKTPPVRSTDTNTDPGPSSNTNPINDNIPASSQHSKDPWEDMLLDSNQSGYDLLVNSFLYPDNHKS